MNILVTHSTLYDPMDYSLPGSSVHEILQAKILEWVAISSSRAGTLCATKTTTIIITNERHEVMTQMKCMLLLFTLVLNKY